IIVARDQLGDCYHELAVQAGNKMKTAADSAKVFYRDKRLGFLKSGVGTYDELADALLGKETLTPVEQGMLGNALLRAADMTFDTNDYPEALRRYKSVQDRYRRHVAGLIACHKIW